MKMTKKLMVVALAMPLFVGSVVYAGGDHRDGERHGKKGYGCGERGVMHQLDLTDEQKEEMKALRLANRDRMEQGEDRKAAREAQQVKVEQLLVAERFDETAAQKIADDRASSYADRVVQKLADQHQMMSILTPEQKAKFVELKQATQSNECGERHGRGKRGHDMRNARD